MTGYEIHLASDLLVVYLNLRQWNEDLATDQGKSVWGRRTVTYFVYEPQTGLFAPSKFCAYSVVPTAPFHQCAPPSATSVHGTLNVAEYSSINDRSHALDGSKAVSHLTRRLGWY